MITIYTDLVQGSPEWIAARCGVLTASDMKHVVTPTLKVADNDKTRAHLDEMLAQRLTKHVEPAYIGGDMLRGEQDEMDAIDVYSENYDEVVRVGFITNDRHGFVLGYSPDGCVGEGGLVEVKSRRQRFQVRTILDDAMPSDFMLQVQTGLLVSERKWCDFVSYSAGLPMFTKRIYPDEKVQAAILDAAAKFHTRLDADFAKIVERLARNDVALIPTERKDDSILVA
jgi:hypothetical protein